MTKARGNVDDALRIKTILVPTDFSAESLKAIQHASTLAKEFGAILRLVHAVEPPSVLQESLVSAALLSSKELAREPTVRLQAWARDEVDELVPASGRGWHWPP